MTEKKSSQMMYPATNLDTNFEEFNEFKTLETGNCCSNTPIYEISYNHIPRKWLVCIHCVELDFFSTNIKEKVRIKA